MGVSSVAIPALWSEGERLVEDVSPTLVLLLPYVQPTSLQASPRFVADEQSSAPKLDGEAPSTVKVLVL